MRNQRLARTFCLTSLYLFTAHVYAADIAQGKQLHDTHCTRCHIGIKGGDGSLLYTRKDRRINSPAGLDSQVRRCSKNVGTDWSEDQIKSVVTYLNKQYYKFPK